MCAGLPAGRTMRGFHCRTRPARRCLAAGGPRRPRRRRPASRRRASTPPPRRCGRPCSRSCRATSGKRGSSPRRIASRKACRFGPGPSNRDSGDRRRASIRDGRRTRSTIRERGCDAPGDVPLDDRPRELQTLQPGKEERIEVFLRKMHGRRRKELGVRSWNGEPQAECVLTKFPKWPRIQRAPHNPAFKRRFRFPHGDSFLPLVLTPAF